jgi:hypothetical protein
MVMLCKILHIVDAGPEAKLSDGNGSRYLKVPFQQLAAKRQFHKIIDVITKESKETICLWFQDDLTRRNNLGKGFNTAFSAGETPLHRIVAVQPPACLIEVLVECIGDIYKNIPEDATDALGRTPLHLAATYACHSDVIHRLSNGSSAESLVTAALMLDAWQRCPLHWACSHKNARVGPDNNIFSKLRCQFNNEDDDMVYSVSILIEAYPEATLIRDLDGMTPLDLALKYEADPKIIALVDFAAKRVSRGRQHKKGVWDNEVDSSWSTTEVDSFPKGFPGEISLFSHSNSTPEARSPTEIKPSRYTYSVFEC